MEVGKYRYRCKYPNCNNKYYSPITDVNYKNKHLYNFPKDTGLLEIWKNICEIPENVNCARFYVCEDHFNENDFKNESHHRLNYRVVPRKQVTSTTSREVNITQPCSSNSENTDEIMNVIDQTENSLHTLDNLNQSFDFLLENTTEVNCKGVIGTGLSKKELAPTKAKLYKAYRNAVSKISKLKNGLEKHVEQLKIVKSLYEEGKFEYIEANLNSVSKEFLKSQLRNCNKKPNGKRWTVEDKALALSLYKRSPRLYKHMLNFFEFPSVRTLKQCLSKIPFNSGINPLMLEHLKYTVEKMNPLDRHCVIIFDEVKLASGLHYEAHRQVITGYEDFGHLGRNSKLANHALVFMVRGIRKNWKQALSYYFTSGTVPTMQLKDLNKENIQELQKTGLKILATVCDQGVTNQAALKQLCENAKDAKVNAPSASFIVNDQPICVVYDVPHLLKNTRNCLLRAKIQYKPGKEAKFEYIEKSFNLDKEKRSYSQLPKLKRCHFNFKDTYLKMKVNVAAAQLSSSVAACIETWVSMGLLPAEAMHTAEFAETMDKLFDSLNSSGMSSNSNKIYRCALTNTSPHLEFWQQMLIEIKQWRILDLNSNKDTTNLYSFLNGWQTTLQSIIYIWDTLKNIGFKYLSIRSFNQDPLENLFGVIRQHGICNTNPTCHQFVAALKTAVVNSFTSSVNNGNCEVDECSVLSSLRHFFTETSTNVASVDYSNAVEEDVTDPNTSKIQFKLDLDVFENNNQATAYVTGYILKGIKIPDEYERCQDLFFSENVTNKHLYVYFKEYDDSKRLTYASEKIINLADIIYEKLYTFLNTRGFENLIETTFCQEHKGLFNVNTCPEHNYIKAFTERCVRLLIYKFCKDIKEDGNLTESHNKKIKKLKTK